MPELAEVEYYRKQWAVAYGLSIQSVHFNSTVRIIRDLDLAQLRYLKNTRLIDSFSHGKKMLFRFKGKSSMSCWLGVHLGMTGKLKIIDQSQPFSKWDHFALIGDRQTLVFEDPRQFGKITLDRGVHFPQWWAEQPPEILSKQFSVQRFKQILNRHQKTPLKSFLLNQAYFPGIGNWMADEVLWRAKVVPHIHASILSVEEVHLLWKMLRQVARDALRVIGRDWSNPPKSWLFLHRWKDGGFCPRDQIPLRRAKIGGRTTCWCPSCQQLERL